MWNKKHKYGGAAVVKCCLVGASQGCLQASERLLGAGKQRQVLTQVYKGFIKRNDVCVLSCEIGPVGVPPTLLAEERAWSALTAEPAGAAAPFPWLRRDAKDFRRLLLPLPAALSRSIAVAAWGARTPGCFELPLCHLSWWGSQNKKLKPWKLELWKTPKTWTLKNGVGKDKSKTMTGSRIATWCPAPRGVQGPGSRRQLAACAFRACFFTREQDGSWWLSWTKPFGQGLREQAARPGGTREELVDGLSGHREKSPRAQTQKLMHKVTTTLLFMWLCSWWRWCARGWSWSWSWSPHSVFLLFSLFYVSFSVSLPVCCKRARGLTFTSALQTAHRRGRPHSECSLCSRALLDRLTTACVSSPRDQAGSTGSHMQR